uniref:Solute carrier family 25 member 17 n=1 Tax=Gasterosteus aculeatus aculeatus TaxID=481459 RepID=A0AAQ4R2F8_GASAC
MSDNGGSAVSLLSYETLVHAVAGAMGSVTAMTVFFPLDTAKSRLQVDEMRKSNSTPVILAEIAKEEGLLSLYRGWLPVISSLCCSNFVYFYTFNTLKKLAASGPGKSRPGKDLLMGVVSGMVNVILTTPMWVVNTRLKLQGAKFRNEDLQQTQYKGIFDAFSQIVANEGVATLWNGTLPSLILVLNPAVQFMIYEAMKRKAGRGGKKISSAEIFLIGAIAKAIATTATFPLQTIQAILREVRRSRPVQRPGGQAAADGADGCPHVCGVREHHHCYLQSHGPEQESEAVNQRLLEFSGPFVHCVSSRFNRRLKM